MFDTIGKKLKTIFGTAAKDMPENPSAAEIDNFLDDMIAATENAKKGTQENINKSKLEELENKYSDLVKLTETLKTSLENLNKSFGKQIGDTKTELEGKITSVSDSVTSLKNDVASDLAKIKTAKTQDLSTQQKEVDKKTDEKEDKKDGERKVMTFDWMKD